MLNSSDGAFLRLKVLILSALLALEGFLFTGCSASSPKYTPKILLETQKPLVLNKGRKNGAFGPPGFPRVAESKPVEKPETYSEQALAEKEAVDFTKALPKQELEEKKENNETPTQQAITTVDSTSVKDDFEKTSLDTETPSGSLLVGNEETETPETGPQADEGGTQEFKVELVKSSVGEAPDSPMDSHSTKPSKTPDAPTVEPQENIPVKETVVKIPNQELIDSTLDYWQAANDFWEQGDLEKAIAALDQAYALILKISDDAIPELLQQKEDLRITISRQIIEVYSSRSTVANGTYKAIPLEMNEHVKKALDLFKGRNRKFFLESYVRSGRYRPAIVRALKEAGLPEELSWLPLIESGFKLRAFSSARALGMWQFIASTGYKFGLKRGGWVDERMDPAKSTKAAVAYLTELHQIFGDWTTALAAYNCGENRVLRNIRTQKVAYLDNFWDLYRKLPSETAFYVPKFLAVLHIINSPESHGFKLPPVAEELKIDSVTINKQASLKDIAKNIGISFVQLKAMNPELRRGVTPPRSYKIQIPEGKGELLLAKIDEIPLFTPPVPMYIVHRVKRGESLSGIAKRYRTSIASIMKANRLRKRSFIKAGWKLKIPSARYAARQAAPPAQSFSPGKEIRYTVRRGDSLWKIARKFKSTVNSIKALNSLKGTRLQAGQKLKISAGRPTATPPDLQIAYHVKKGDSPYIIAKRHNMGLSDFLTLNSLTPKSTIYPGQRLMVHNKSF
ncbi:MAG: LysM peptidoglycan-binding domain-containing protein [Nitrospinota bacterium]